MQSVECFSWNMQTAGLACLRAQVGAVQPLLAQRRLVLGAAPRVNARQHRTTLAHLHDVGISRRQDDLDVLRLGLLAQTLALVWCRRKRQLPLDGSSRLGRVALFASAARTLGQLSRGGCLGQLPPVARMPRHQVEHLIDHPVLRHRGPATDVRQDMVGRHVGHRFAHLARYPNNTTAHQHTQHRRLGLIPIRGKDNNAGQNRRQAQRWFVIYLDT